MLVPSRAQLSPWVGLLYLLAEEASGLRWIKICWNSAASDYSPYSEPAWNWERGLGDNLLFVRALGKIKGLEELVIQGCYAKNWPTYLEERMSVRVQAIPLRDWCFLTEYEDLSEYQLGTENLIP